MVVFIFKGCNGGYVKNIIKRILAFFLVVYLIIVPPFAYAASAGGWAFSAYDVPTSVVKAMKNGASASVAVAKSPITTKIGKGILGGVIAGAAIPLAISQISGIALNAVDWVLDPVNNAVKYKVVNDPLYGEPGQYLWKSQGVTASTALEAAQAGAWANTAICKGKNVPCVIKNIRPHPDGNPNWFAFNVDDSSNIYIIVRSLNPNYVADDTVQYKTIPISTVADKIYDNAKTDTASASIVNDAVKDYVNEGSADVALDAAKAETDATNNCGTGTSWNGSACVADTPTTPTTPTTPDTPFDPSGIIDAIRSVFDAVKSIPDVINSAIDKVTDKLDVKFKDLTDMATDWKDAFVNEYQTVKDKVDNYFNDEPVMTDTPLPESNPTLKDPSEFDKDYIKVTAQCPDDVERQIPVGNMSFTLRFPMSPLCDFLSTYARPVIILMAYITAALSIGNAFRVGG